MPRKERDSKVREKAPRSERKISSGVDTGKKKAKREHVHKPDVSLEEFLEKVPSISEETISSEVSDRISLKEIRELKESRQAAFAIERNDFIERLDIVKQPSDLIVSEGESKVYVLDTNIILNDANNLFVISQNGQNTLVLPETVIDEIDSKKTGFDEINFQAREFGRILADAQVLKSVTTKKANIVSIAVGTLKIDIVSLVKYDIEGLDKKNVNDRKIIFVAKFAKKHYKSKEVKLLSLDVMCRIRAIAFDVVTDSLSYSKKDRVVNFIKTIELNETETIPKDIIDFDPEYKIENFAYIFKKGEAETYTVIKNGKVYPVAYEDFVKGTIKPKNTGQLFAMTGMMDEDYNVVLIEALAGSGKTLMAVEAAIQNVQQKRYNKIIYIRNSIDSVDKGEDIGYLSGNKEKLEVYNHPLFDTLEFIVAARSSKKNESNEVIQEKVKEITKRYKIETMWTGSIRGRTISDAYVIIDEVQNFSRKSLQTVLSRLDKGCKVVCIGSNAQIDNSFINKYTNGLSTLLEQVEIPQNKISLFATKLDKVERGILTEWAEEVFTKVDKQPIDKMKAKAIASKVVDSKPVEVEHGPAEAPVISTEVKDIDQNIVILEAE
jgi:PhoH-like ATPase